MASRSFCTELFGPEQEALLEHWLAQARPTSKTSSFELLFRATRDGFNPGAFHRKCDRQGPTVVLARSAGGHVFGGYADMPWSLGSGWTECCHAFLFRLAPLASKHLMLQKSDGRRIGICHEHGATFGVASAWQWGGSITVDGHVHMGIHDLNLLKQGRERQVSSHLGVGFSRQDATTGVLEPGDTSASLTLAESIIAEVTEVEVFAVRSIVSPRRTVAPVGCTRETCLHTAMPDHARYCMHCGHPKGRGPRRQTWQPVRKPGQFGYSDSWVQSP